VFGGGSVGRGFLGQLFSESGYEVVFVDMVQPLLEALAKGSYTLRLSGLTTSEDLTVGPVRAIDGRDSRAIEDAVASAVVLATAVGVRALRAIAKPIAAGLVLRWQNRAKGPVNIIICENLHNAPEVLRGYVLEALSADGRSVLDKRVGFVPAVIARMVPVPTAQQQASDPALIVAEPYKVLPVPEVVGMEPVSPFVAYVERKLYIHNASHALLGYLGYLRGYEYGYEVLDDRVVRKWVDAALDESVRALVAEYNFGTVEMREHVQDLFMRFRNRALADPVSRLARDPLRKLGPQDRLVGAARLAERHGIVPDGIAWGIAAALLYDNPDDALAVELQKKVRPDEPLGEMVREHYSALRDGSAWQTE